MENIGEEYKNYWETNTFLQYEELDRYMDKASIIKDAIEYIQSLHDEEKRIQSEISELELSEMCTTTTTTSTNNSCGGGNGIIFEFDQEVATTFCSNSQPKRTKLMMDHHHEDQFLYDSAGSRSLLSSPIEVLELRVGNMGEKTMVVSLTCSKRSDTMVKLCDIFDSLKLKIITANITAFSGRLFKTVFLEADEEEKDVLRLKIEAAIAALNDPDSPMSF
ncbi:hypothetical protein BUALT_Bualt09G0059100 [Buddleja alternifolia]|uniref:Plant bHLH transcription factor ACT-like domain-containing protein n=1 Tax=Buddleja alternifolia TaxID=168488 RepID=A0AAV6X7L8_9LAMI|nr:hypothetical protein BUALT_Bualt09G0059100 [Buddleja alternifolia]